LNGQPPSYVAELLQPAITKYPSLLLADNNICSSQEHHWSVASKRSVLLAT